MGLRRPGYQRVGFRRTGESGGGGGGGTISQINGSASIDVAGGSGPTATISAKNNGISNAKLAQAPANTLKGNNTAGTANVDDLTVAQVTTLLGLGTAAFQPTTAFDAAGAAAAAQAASQPLDSDLSAIAELTTTTYGRALLTLANQAALQAAAGLGGDFNTYSTNATVCLGTTNLWTFWDDFCVTAAGATGPLGWVADGANSTFAMFNGASAETGGIEYSTLAAVATSRANLYIKAQIFEVGTKDFYVACRQRATTTLGTNQAFGMSVTDTSWWATRSPWGSSIR